MHLQWGCASVGTGSGCNPDVFGMGGSIPHIPTSDPKPVAQRYESICLIRRRSQVQILPGLLMEGRIGVLIGLENRDIFLRCGGSTPSPSSFF